ncbi:hypothetical protein, partial [Kluyvera intermedia]|uniref:hypothetical protein n=1 Tax=Kluyvera intermedia TaxID=61648 RepID=UPI000A70DB60
LLDERAYARIVPNIRVDNIQTTTVFFDKRIFWFSYLDICFSYDELHRYCSFEFFNGALNILMPI